MSVWIEVDICMARSEVKYTQHQESRVVYSLDLRDLRSGPCSMKVLRQPVLTQKVHREEVSQYVSLRGGRCIMQRENICFKMTKLATDKVEYGTKFGTIGH